MAAKVQTAPWWKKGVVYQIYPRSFQDSNGDGIGDLKGITQRLDYLADLGIDCIWLSPCFPSPMADFGYDVANYVDIDKIFGSLEDFDELLREAKQRGLHVVLDLVPNHSSSEHEWFLESRSSRDNPKRDWYIWVDPIIDEVTGEKRPPNWISFFDAHEGSAFEWDEKTQQYYLHLFLKEQPDLNWRNEDLRKAMMDVLHFWYKRGVDGFRIDVAWCLVKDPVIKDLPRNPSYVPGQELALQQLMPSAFYDLPETHGIIAEMRSISDSYEGDRCLIGEIYLPYPKLMTYYGSEAKPECHLPFNFKTFDLFSGGRWTAANLARLIEEYEASLPTSDSWPNWVLANHDNPRLATRLGPEQARVASVLLLTLRGTPTMYQGDEIGMTNVDIPLEKQQDPFGKRVPGNGRDGERTPMQWSGSEENAGFCPAGVEPWLPLSENYTSVNVHDQLADKHSMLCMYKRLLALRRAHESLSLGSYKTAFVHEDRLLGFYRQSLDQQETMLIIANMSGEPATTSLDSLGPAPSSASPRTIIFSTGIEWDGELVCDDILEVGANEALVIQLPSAPVPIE